MTDPVMDVYGLIGWPVEHSRSPAMHQAAFEELGLNATYVVAAIPPEDLARDVSAWVQRSDTKGFNVTVPHKVAVMDWVDEVDDVAHAIGAVNTVYRNEGRWVGTNTDALGLRRSLQEAGVEIAGCNAIVLGAGGAARAAVHALRDADVHVAARRFDAAQQLGAPTAWNELRDAFENADLVIQATSATMANDAQAFADALPIDALPDHAAVCDLVYVPRVTTVLRRAQARGLKTIDGTGMLVHQGAAAFELWTGQPAPIEVMRDALFASLRT